MDEIRNYWFPKYFIDSFIIFAIKLIKNTLLINFSIMYNKVNFTYIQFSALVFYLYQLIWN